MRTSSLRNSQVYEPCGVWWKPQSNRPRLVCWRVGWVYTLVCQGSPGSVCWQACCMERLDVVGDVCSWKDDSYSCGRKPAVSTCTLQLWIPPPPPWTGVKLRAWLYGIGVHGVAGGCTERMIQYIISEVAKCPVTVWAFGVLLKGSDQHVADQQASVR